jgi:HK97 family phage prohead protease
MTRKPPPRSIQPDVVRYTDAYIERIAEENVEEREIEFVASDETVDRYGDVVTASGWRLKEFRKNPIFLFSHDYHAPIGTVPKVGVVGTRLMATVRLAAAGVSDTADQLWRLMEAKILRAVSVGFTVRSMDDVEAMYDDEDQFTGYRFLKQELLELSLVAVPANPNALAVARSLDVSRTLLARALPPDASVIEAARARSAQLLQLRIRGQRLHMPRQAVPLTHR